MVARRIGAVEAIDLTVRVGDRLVLQDVNFHIDYGDRVAVIGDNGKGKTVLLATLNASLRPEQGLLRILGHDASADVKSSGLRRLRRRIGMAHQHRILDDGTVADCVCDAAIARGASPRDALRDLKMTLAAFDLRSRMNDPAAKLNAGDAARLSLARAMSSLSDGGLVLADEPTANLHPRVACGVMDMLRCVGESHRFTMVVATHDFQALSHFRPNRIVEVRDGGAFIRFTSVGVRSRRLTC